MTRIVICSIPVRTHPLQPFSRFPPLKNQTSDPTAACLQLYKLVEELSVALAASLPACLLVFYLVRLQGSVALFWLVHVVSIAVSTGAVLGSCLAGQTNWSIGEGGRLVSWRQRDGCSVDAYICEHARMLMQVPIATAGLPWICLLGSQEAFMSCKPF